ncbi:unnamed protein product [Caenorhabditis angaria]|uniref:Myb-like domain-containing protein n=1 Tax=Caenorhabditis angaria TaxID=860376 RepID=A0A9P1ITF9_9PELO|nr:unnamed protein product [Caenorhabditis angaria]
MGDLTLQLHTTTDTDESKWTDKEVDNLRDALTRFAHELDQISTCVASRTTKHIKNDIKRRHLIEENNQQVKRMAISATSASGASYSAISTMGPGTTGMHTVPLAQKRIVQPTTKVLATRAVVPTRYTVGPSTSASPSILNNGATMPQLQQQQTARLITTTGNLSSTTRLAASNLAKYAPTTVTAKRIITATIPQPKTSVASAQLVQDSND